MKNGRRTLVMMFRAARNRPVAYYAMCGDTSSAEKMDSALLSDAFGSGYGRRHCYAVAGLIPKPAEPVWSGFEGSSSSPSLTTPVTVTIEARPWHVRSRQSAATWYRGRTLTVER